MTRKDEPVFGNHHAFGKIPERFDHHLARLRKPMIAQFRNGRAMGGSPTGAAAILNALGTALLRG
jgi:hypothetical protein